MCTGRACSRKNTGRCAAYVDNQGKQRDLYWHACSYKSVLEKGTDLIKIAMDGKLVTDKATEMAKTGKMPEEPSSLGLFGFQTIEKYQTHKHKLCHLKPPYIFCAQEAQEQAETRSASVSPKRSSTRRACLASAPLVLSHSYCNLVALSSAGKRGCATTRSDSFHSVAGSYSERQHVAQPNVPSANEETAISHSSAAKDDGGCCLERSKRKWRQEMESAKRKRDNAVSFHHYVLTAMRQ